jgi:hypothetical protein
VEISNITGYSQSWISTLQRDPAFGDLLEYYSSQKAEVYTDVHQRLSELGLNAVEELAQRLAEEGEEMSNKELLAIAELALDRSSAPPKGVAKGGTTGGAVAPVQIAISFQKSPHSIDAEDAILITGPGGEL